MTNDDPTDLGGQLEEAFSDETGRSARVTCSLALAAAMGHVGHHMWVAGSIFGPDRAAGHSPFDFGDDAMVGIATAAQVGGELLTGIGALLPLGNRYAAMALCRQLVEVQYLAWAFTEDRPEAAHWLRSSREQRLEMWAPARLRKRAAGRFNDADFWLHCEHGGHPTPTATSLLPNHSKSMSVDFCWFEAAAHGTSIWNILVSAAHTVGHDSLFLDSQEVSAAEQAIVRWQAVDPARSLRSG